MKKKLKIIFMGTPEFALPSLKALVKEYQILAIVTNPDKASGRGKQVKEGPIKEYAKEEGIDILQPERARDKDFIDRLASYGADLFVTCAYGKILPEEVFNMPPLGCINIHASLLPKYRGPAPIWHAIINGESESGITTMMTDKGMDTGDMLLKRRVDIGPDMTTGQLHDLLSDLGSKLIIETIEGIRENKIHPTSQKDEEASYAPMVNRETGRIDFTKDSKTIHNLIRGTNPFPGSYCYVEGEKLKVWRSKLAEEKFEGEPGQIIGIGKEGALVKTVDGVLRIIEVQAENARRMDFIDYSNGKRLALNTRLY